MSNSPTARSGRFPRPSIVVLPLLFAPLFGIVIAQQGAGSSSVGAGEALLLLVLLLLSGFMSGSETALTAVGEWKIRQLREEGLDPRGVFGLLERDPTRFITTILIANNLVNIAATALVTQISIRLSRGAGFSESLAVGYATFVMTLLVLVFGEITPKSIAVHHSVPFARAVIRPVYLLSIILYPIGRFFAFLVNGILRLLRLEPSEGALITENELRLMLRSAEESGVIEAQEQEMIRGIIGLEETVVREVMTPRVDVIAISESATLRELLELTTEHRVSRLPVYSDTVDNIRGIVYARDLLPYLGRSEELATTTVSNLMSAPHYVPETLSVLALLRDMRIRKNHISVVVDEFGGTAGVVTLEDIIEEITGEIYDETDIEEDEEIMDLGAGLYRILGSAHLEEVASKLKIAFHDDGEYDTMAGFLISEFGYIPTVGESVGYEGVVFEVEAADERRVQRVMARFEAPVQEAETIEDAGDR